MAEQIKGIKTSELLQSVTSTDLCTQGNQMVDGVAINVRVSLEEIPAAYEDVKTATIPGSSYYGDHVPALLNSGEMVLNASQQANLFRMIDGGASGQMQAKVTVEGDKLAVLIDRVNAKRRRVR